MTWSPPWTPICLRLSSLWHLLRSGVRKGWHLADGWLGRYPKAVKGSLDSLCYWAWHVACWELVSFFGARCEGPGKGRSLAQPTFPIPQNTWVAAELHHARRIPLRTARYTEVHPSLASLREPRERRHKRGMHLIHTKGASGTSKQGHR